MGRLAIAFDLLQFAAILGLALALRRLSRRQARLIRVVLSDRRPLRDRLDEVIDRAAQPIPDADDLDA